MREMCALAFWGGNWNNVAVQKWGRRDKGNGTTRRGPHRQPLYLAFRCFVRANAEGQ
jgi:hypothetical protein